MDPLCVICMCYTWGNKSSKPIQNDDWKIFIERCGRYTKISVTPYCSLFYVLHLLYITHFSILVIFRNYGLKTKNKYCLFYNKNQNKCNRKSSWMLHKSFGFHNFCFFGFFVFIFDFKFEFLIYFLKHLKHIKKMFWTVEVCRKFGVQQRRGLKGNGGNWKQKADTNYIFLEILENNVELEKGRGEIINAEGNGIVVSKRIKLKGYRGAYGRDFAIRSSHTRNKGSWTSCTKQPKECNYRITVTVHQKIFDVRKNSTKGNIDIEQEESLDEDYLYWILRWWKQLRTWWGKGCRRC